MELFFRIKDTRLVPYVQCRVFFCYFPLYLSNLSNIYIMAFLLLCMAVLSFIGTSSAELVPVSPLHTNVEGIVPEDDQHSNKNLLVQQVLDYVAPSGQSASPKLRTRNGTYAGLHSEPFDQDFFLGVPFAQAPLNDLRWRIPQSLNTSFSGLRDATAYSSNCIGLGADSWAYPLSEDCLYLNVIRPHQPDNYKWKAEDDDEKLLPIAVWIHGGGFYMGGSGDLRFNLSHIVENGQKAGTPFIGISLNYRLNGFGFMYSNEIRGEGATNLGLRDQRLALHWV